MKLHKEIGFWGVFSIASGMMISAGIFILPGLAYAQAGPAMILSYLLAGLLASFGMLSIAELVTAMPKAGGDYFFITRSMGPAIGMISGLLSWFSFVLKSAFALLGIAAFMNLLAPLNVHGVAISFCFGFLVLNLLGVREASRVQVAVVVLLFVLMTAYLLAGFPAIDVRHFEGFLARGWGSVFSTAGFVFVSYGGLLKVISIAEEVKEPGRNIPLAMIASLLVVGSFYTLVVFVTTGLLSGEQLGRSLTPLSDGAAVVMGPWGRRTLSLAALLAFVSTANAGIMAASRYPLALSRDGFLPGFLAKVNRRFRTPHFSILATGFLMVLALFLNLKTLVKAASTALIITYLLSCLSIIILRESRLLNYQPRFHSPLYPWIQILGIAGFLALIVKMGIGSVIVGLSFIAGGFFLWWFYLRIRDKREYALLHLIKRITAKELLSRTLESELKEIIRERDEIVKDRFDKVIEESIVLDREKALRLEEFFEEVAQSLSASLEMSPASLRNLFLEREEESSTVLTPFLAIPHIVVAGQRHFRILLARSRKGIFFSDSAEAVKAVFVLVGTKDERNFHLRALSAIAQIVQDSHFETRWLSAQSKEGLRDIILLGERRRHAGGDASSKKSSG